MHKNGFVRLLATLLPLSSLTQLVSVHADNNKLTSLEGLSFGSLERLVDLSCSGNEINVLTPDVSGVVL